MLTDDSKLTKSKGKRSDPSKYGQSSSKCSESSKTLLNHSHIGEPELPTPDTSMSNLTMRRKRSERNLRVQNSQRSNSINGTQSMAQECLLRQS
jgi:hypothetical protein